MGNPFVTAKKVFYDGAQLSRIYCNSILLYSWIEPPIEIAIDSLEGTANASDYEEGSTTFGALTLSEGVDLSEDGIEIANQETFASAAEDNISYPITLEFKGRIDKYASSNPPMVWGMGNTLDKWGSGCICCYAHQTYGLIIDSNATARKIITKTTPTYAHLVFVIDSSGVPTFYINGLSHNFTFASDAACTGSKIYFYNGEGRGRFVGAINTMRWWNRDLTTAEIAQLFAADEGSAYDIDLEIDYDILAYENYNVVLDGNTYIDTGIQLFDTNKNFKLEVTFTSDKSDYDKNTIGTVLHCMHEAQPYPGIVLDTNGTNNTHYRFATTAGSLSSTISATSLEQHTFIAEYNTKASIATLTFDGNSQEQSISYTAVNETMILGAYMTTDNTYGRYWEGTISSIKVWYSSEH